MYFYAHDLVKELGIRTRKGFESGLDHLQRLFEAGRFIEFSVATNDRGPKAVGPMRLLPEDFDGRRELETQMNPYLRWPDDEERAARAGSPSRSRSPRRRPADALPSGDARTEPPPRRQRQVFNAFSAAPAAAAAAAPRGGPGPLRSPQRPPPGRLPGAPSVSPHVPPVGTPAPRKHKKPGRLVVHPLADHYNQMVEDGTTVKIFDKPPPPELTGRELLLAECARARRSSMAAHVAWQEYCDKEDKAVVPGARGRRNPDVHTDEFIRGYLQRVKGLVPPPTPTPGSTPMGMSAAAAAGVDTEFGKLVKQVRQKLHFSTRTAKDWRDLCKASGERVFNPSKQTVDFLQGFLACIDDGIMEQPVRDEEWQRLVKEVEKRRKSSSTMRKHWASFCALNGLGVQDPSRHEIDFLELFLLRMDFWEEGDEIRTEDGLLGAVGVEGLLGSGAPTAAPAEPPSPA